MTATSTQSETLVAAARALAPRIRALADEIERGRRLPPALVADLRAAGLWRLKLPASLGGHEADPVTILRVVEEVSRADGAAGWTLMIGTDHGYFATWLGEQAARDLYARWPEAIFAGALAPGGARAFAVEGGYRVSGRWPFASGVHQADWVLVGAVIYDGDTPRPGLNDWPAIVNLVFPASEITLLDTWHVSGLRGSGSNDFTASDVFVPASLSFNPLTDRPVHPGALYAFPMSGFMSANTAAVTLGIARHAIEALVELAAAKTPTGQTSLLRERAAVQADVARAEALVRSGRAFLYDVVAETFALVSAGATVSRHQRALVRAAAVHAATSAACAVDLMYNAGGATAIYDTSPLQRCFRDVHAATQHTTLSPAVLEASGKALLAQADG